MRSSGFTLLEMLLAMVVIAVVGITISTATGNVASQTFTLERHHGPLGGPESDKPAAPQSARR